MTCVILLLRGSGFRTPAAHPSLVRSRPSHVNSKEDVKYTGVAFAVDVKACPVDVN